MKKIALFLATGFEETEAIGVIDLLRRAGMTVDIISSGDMLDVESAHKLSVRCDFLFSDIVDFDSYDGYVLPGGLPGVPNLMKNEQLISLLDKSHREGKLICAICAAPSILANMGLLDGKNATVYPGFETEGRGVIFTGNGVEVAGNIITSKGLGFVFDFALTIIEKTISRDKAIEVANAIQYSYN